MMKMNLVFLFVLNLFTLQNAFSSENDCSLIQSNKSILQLKVDDFLNDSGLQFCSPKDSAALNKLFQTFLNLNQLKDSSLTSEQISAVYNKIQQVSNREHSLVKVGSTLEEVLTSSEISVTGVGSVIGFKKSNDIKNYSSLKYYVLTASHLVSGKNPFIVYNGQHVSAKVVKIDFDTDLALLDFSFNTQVLPIGLVSNGLIFTNFNLNFNKNEISDIVHDIRLQTIQFEPWVIDDYTRPASVLAKASWLFNNSKLNFEEALHSRFQVPRENSNQIIAPFYFAEGFSGSPILATYRLRLPDPNSFLPEFAYIVGGVLSLSSRDANNPVTVASSISDIQKFLTSKSDAQSKQDNNWYLLGPYFMKWSETNKAGLLYNGIGPIGNGVVVEGLPALDSKINPTPIKLNQVNSVNIEAKALLQKQRYLDLIKSNPNVKLMEPMNDKQLDADLEKLRKSIHNARVIKE